MAVFGGMTLTNKGLVLQGKAQAGGKLNYTRIAVGDGSLTGQAVPAMNGLISQKINLPITRITTQPPNKAIIGSVLRNADVSTGFYWREVGVFAQDPDAGEILYAYANAGVTADYIPPGGGSDIIEKTFDCVVVVGTAANITAVIDDSLVFAKKSELDTVEAAKVDKVSGKGLSANDYTTAEKNKLAGITAGAGGAGTATDAVIGSRTATDNITPSLTGSITTLFSSLFTLIKGITGKASALTGPATTLEAAKAHADDTTRHLTATERAAWNAKANKSDIPSSLPASGGNADTVDNYHLNQDVRTTASPTFNGMTITDPGNTYGHKLEITSYADLISPYSIGFRNTDGSAQVIHVGSLVVSESGLDVGTQPEKGALIQGIIESRVEQGTAPFTVASATQVDKLNVEYHGGKRINELALLDSPNFTGIPKAPTAPAGTNTTQLSTTAFVESARQALVAADALKAPLASPALTGVPTAPTAAAGNNSTQLATTAFVAALGALKLNASAYTAADVIAKLLTVDGVGSGLDADLLDGKQLIDVVQGTLVYAVTTGTTAALAASITPAPVALSAGMRVSIKAHLATTGAVTLNLNGLGAKPIKKPNSNNPQFAQGGVYTLVYDGSAFILQGEGGEYGNVVADQVLNGVQFGNENGLDTGIMPNRSGENHHMPALEYTVWAGDKVFLKPPNGWYSGESWVVAPATDIHPNNFPEDKNVLGIQGAMPRRGVYTAPLSTTWDGNYMYVRIPVGAYQTTSGSGYPEIQLSAAQARADNNIMPNNIRGGTRIYGVVGTLVPVARYRVEQFVGNGDTVTVESEFSRINNIVAVLVYPKSNPAASSGVISYVDGQLSVLREPSPKIYVHYSAYSQSTQGGVRKMTKISVTLKSLLNNYADDIYVDFIGTIE
ncbi:phage tail protein [Paenibacillus sp. FSL K6-1217]|uniref:phage tail-collar fiber domain-containing protein n=1 Tax=Paenibacillus sp. FSL K6-1217 TaxID=2921466 RepID=UPI00325293C4